MVIFKRAIEQTGIKYVERFLDILDDFASYSFSKDLKTEILDFMKANFNESEETWNILAKQCTSELNNHKRFKITDQEFKNALQRFTNEKMWNFYFDYLLNNLKLNLGTKEEQFYLNKLDEELRNCFQASLISKSTFLSVIEQLNSLKCSMTFIQIIIKYGLDRWENDLVIWHFYFKSLINCNGTKVEIKNLFNKILKLISSQNQFDDDNKFKCTFIDFIQLFIEWAIQNLTERELIKILETNCTINLAIQDLSFSRNIVSHFKPILLEQISKYTDCQMKRRQMYEKYKLMNPIVKEFYLKMIELEIGDIDANGELAISNVKLIRKVFNEMLNQFGDSNHRLWLNFCEFELKFGSYVEISRIYEIAKKQLNAKESDLFVQNYSLLHKKLAC